MAASEHYPGCWRKHLTCARNTVEFETARRQRAENALLEILRAGAWEARLTEWRKHSVTAVGTQPTPQEACREIRAIARAALANAIDRETAS